jgi:hypothetical protein
MSNTKDNRAPVAGYVLPRQVPMPRFDYQRANSSTNSVKGSEEERNKAGEGAIKIKSLQNLRFG